MKEGANGDVGIKQMHDQNPNRNHDQKLGVPLGVLEQQVKKRNKETSNHDRGAKDVPGLDIPVNKPLGFFRNIGVPNQHVLAEADVTPKDRKTEKQFTHDVVMLFVDKAEVTGTL
jgi:hypothetical protein